jgi:hypothetical protein
MRDEVMTRLRELPAAIQRAELALFEAEETRRQVAEHVAQREAELLLSGEIDGKNEAQRKAQLAAALSQERQAQVACDGCVRRKQIELHRAQHEFGAMRALAYLLAERRE